jgi:hypothetical protein
LLKIVMPLCNGVTSHRPCCCAIREQIVLH